MTSTATGRVAAGEKSRTSKGNASATGAMTSSLRPSPPEEVPAFAPICAAVSACLGSVVIVNACPPITEIKANGKHRRIFRKADQPRIIDPVQTCGRFFPQPIRLAQWSVGRELDLGIAACRLIRPQRFTELKRLRHAAARKPFHSTGTTEDRTVTVLCKVKASPGTTSA